MVRIRALPTLNDPLRSGVAQVILEAFVGNSPHSVWKGEPRTASTADQLSWEKLVLKDFITIQFKLGSHLGLT